MAGAVDLSALKRPAGESAAAGGAPPNIPNAVEITEANFEAEVLIRSGEVPVVVVVWSPRSDASVQLAETLGAFAGQDAGKWVLATVDADTTPRVAQAFGVQAIPTVVALAAGQPLSNFQGMQPPEQLRKWVDSLLEATAGKLSGGSSEEPEQVDPALAAARTHLESGDFEAAKSAYEAILAADPGHAEAKGAIRQITFLSRATAQNPDAVAAADADPDNVEAAFAAADVQLLSQDVAGAFERLISLVKRTAGDERAAVRARLVELFELFDAADPDVIAGRRNLANALF
ncbi:tetratricopeptide repeat protein [[Mycobacterium] wendilense]|uniref:Tetratricopeptide repeat protein n=2 Tax=[Mycobacterium] wendilense TaxID=3064284 RepID=A0ABM9MBF4_9MYCO|nr:tetratricopeptide repeat protein [Mycolicibacterium sp. MU0050]CAJ1581109.1 tetratricopeptide repeat protein [Mycolicibacterium sp. MU0050]